MLQMNFSHLDKTTHEKRARAHAIHAICTRTHLPRNRMLAPDRTMSATMRALPLMARPARQLRTRAHQGGRHEQALAGI